ncbi:hypothetical protein FDUTEX481_10054 [Tolypothrix sp. PCC 7601]|nr:hypothetical protein FDUTEX481_10054 [Tolypothrix sp. PCC 7601]
MTNLSLLSRDSYTKRSPSIFPANILYHGGVINLRSHFSQSI